MRMIKMRNHEYKKLIHTFIRVFGVFPRGFSSREGLYYTVIDHEKARAFGMLEEENVKQLERIAKERAENIAKYTKNRKISSSNQAA
jgi:hypothetical protein